MEFSVLNPDPEAADNLINLTLTKREAHLLRVAINYGIEWSKSGEVGEFSRQLYILITKHLGSCYSKPLRDELLEITRLGDLPPTKVRL